MEEKITEDGLVSVVRGFINPFTADACFTYLAENVNWVNTMTNDKGEQILIRRKMAYLSDTPSIYKYANLSFQGETWKDYDIVEDLSYHIQDTMDMEFNSVLLNMYKDGKDTINWHSDKEESLGENAEIACLNLGATRKFWFREQGEDKEKFSVDLANGDLLLMNAGCQEKYLHAILKESAVKEPRISLTFRWNYDNIH